VTLLFAVSGVGIVTSALIVSSIPDILVVSASLPASAGATRGIGRVAGIVLAPVVGQLADRWGRRPMLTTCLALFGPFEVLAVVAPS
jgi:MFS family permease